MRPLEPLPQRDAIETAQNVREQAFPACDATFLGRSVVRGETIATSDLDGVLVTREMQVASCQSLYASGWPVEGCWYEAKLGQQCR